MSLHDEKQKYYHFEHEIDTVKRHLCWGQGVFLFSSSSLHWQHVWPFSALASCYLNGTSSRGIMMVDPNRVLGAVVVHGSENLQSLTLFCCLVAYVLCSMSGMSPVSIVFAIFSAGCDVSTALPSHTPPLSVISTSLSQQRWVTKQTISQWFFSLPFISILWASDTQKLANLNEHDWSFMVGSRVRRYKRLDDMDVSTVTVFPVSQ